jgi:hypothetical protein
MTAETKTKTMHEAFLEAYAEMPDPVKNADNPAFKRDGKVLRYADLEAFLDVAKPILLAAGFALIQEPVSDGSLVGVHTWLLYKTGEVMDFGRFTVALSKPDPQGAGAAITYCRRYAAASIFALVQEDDDANRVSDTGQGATNGAGKAYGSSGSGNGGGATESQVKAIFGKAKALGWDNEYLFGSLERSLSKNHPELLTKAEATKMLDYLQGKLDEREASGDVLHEPESRPVTEADFAPPADEDIPF